MKKKNVQIKREEGAYYYVVVEEKRRERPDKAENAAERCHIVFK